MTRAPFKLKQDINLYHKIHGEREQLLLYGQQTRPTILGRTGGQHPNPEAQRRGSDGYCDRQQPTAWPAVIIALRWYIGSLAVDLPITVHRAFVLIICEYRHIFRILSDIHASVAGCPILQTSHAESGTHYSRKYPPWRG